MTTPTRVAIGLGTNLGVREENLAYGVRRLAERGVTWEAISSLYETVPVGFIEDVPLFLNQAAVGVTNLSPQALLQVCLETERERGRVRYSSVLSTRTLDLDVLLYGEEVIEEADLRVPHAQLARRAFVLAPLAEVAPEWIVPGTQGQTVKTLAEAVPGKEGVRLWQSSDTKPPTRAER